MAKGARLLLATFVAVCACGGSSVPTSPAPPSAPPSPTAGSTIARIVDSLNNGRPIAGASVSTDTLGTATSNADGYVTLQATGGLAHTIRVSAPSWVERLTLLKVPGEQTTVSLIPQTLPLGYFDEMCRSFGSVARWRTAPALVVETSVLQYASRTATTDTVPADLVARTMEEVRRTLPILSSNRFPEFASIEVRTTAAGTASAVPDGAIGLTWQRGLAGGFGHVAYGNRVRGADGWLIRGEVALDYDWHALHLPAGSRTDYFNVVQHEQGHTLGYSHTKTAPSFMYEVYLMTVSGLDRQAFEVYMQRPSGNQTPDVDPTGVTLNLLAPSEEMLTPRCAFLRVK